MRKGIISVIFCIVAIFSFAVTAWAVDASWLENTHYGYSSLSTAGEKSAYKAIYEGIEDAEGAITIDTGWHITRDQLIKICRYYMHDSPEHCWLMADGNTFDYTYDTVDGTAGAYITRVKPKYNGSKDSMAAKFNNAVKAIVDKANSGTNYDKALKAHDLLALQVDYDYDVLVGSGSGNIAHRAYGALVNDLAVCDGYAYAYQVILNKMGIKAITVPGYGSGTIGGAHAWNMVEFETGKWAYVDVTWDDQFNIKTKASANVGILHYYFGRTDDIIAKDMAELNNGGKADHLISLVESGKPATYDGIPSAVSNGSDGLSPYSFFKNVDFDGSSDIDVRKIAGTITRYGTTERVSYEFMCGGEFDFANWLKVDSNKNLKAICNVDNLTPNTYGQASFYDDDYYFLRVYTHTHTGGTANCMYGKICEDCGEEYTGLGDHNYGTLEPRVAATTTQTGLKEHFYCPLCHRYFDKDKNEVKYEDLIIKKYTPGDINGDGYVNNKDVIMLFNYSVNENLPGVIVDACNPDGKDGFTNKDITYLFKYVSKVKVNGENIVLH